MRFRFLETRRPQCCRRERERERETESEPSNITLIEMRFLRLLFLKIKLSVSFCIIAIWCTQRRTGKLMGIDARRGRFDEAIPTTRPAASAQGLPDFSWYNIPNLHQISTKYTKFPQNTPNFHKIHQISTKYTKCPQNTPNFHKIHQMSTKYITCPENICIKRP
jgi:hypothetical protein